MKIPDFTAEGELPKGIHICSGQEFIDRFCSSGNKTKYEKPISDILDFAKSRNAVEIFIGGSFITANENPKDIDCVIVFKEDKYIPSRTERVAITGLKFDILYASLESRNLIDSYIKLFSTGRYGQVDLGIIQIDLYSKNALWEIKHEPDEKTFEIIKRAYNDRDLIEINEKAGILVTIHGLLSRAEWNMDIVPVASSQGWIVAPYFYEENGVDLLFSKTNRDKVVDDFRNWLYDIVKRFDGNVSIISHSFGTYIVAAYLDGFDEKEPPPVALNGIVMTGSILNVDFNWEKYKGLSVGSVYNMVAPNDEFVKYMPETDWKKIIGMSSLFGLAGLKGFTSKASILNQSTNNIFTHTNTIKRDIIETKWMPFLNAKKNSIDREYIEYLKRKKQ